MNKSNRIIFFFTFMFLVVILSVSQVSSQPINVTNYSVSSNYDGVQVTMIKYTPYPANPGEYIDLWVQASLGSSVDYAKFVVAQNFPFSVDSGDSASQTYTNMASREVVMHFKVRISQDAVAGMNNLKLDVITNPSTGSYTENDLGIYVENAQTSFDTVVQEESGSSVSLAVANIGENTANSLIVRIPDQKDFRVSGTNGQMVGNLNAGDYSLVNFDITPVIMRGSQGVQGENNLTVEIDYTDSIGVRRVVYENVTFNPTYSSNATSFVGASGSSGTFFVNGQRVSGGFQRNSGGIAWWVWLLIIITIIIVAFLTLRNNKYFLKIFKRNSGKKSPKGNSELPDWIKKEKSKGNPNGK